MNFTKTIKVNSDILYSILITKVERNNNKVESINHINYQIYEPTNSKPANGSIKEKKDGRVTIYKHLNGDKPVHIEEIRD